MNKTHAPTITCPTCSGKGRVPLSNVLLDTLRVVTLHPWRSASQIHKMVSDARQIKVMAVNNRLVYLLNLGLVAREKDSYCWKWTAVKGKK